MRKRLLAVVATTGGLLSAACGSSGTSGPVTAPSPPAQTPPPAVNVAGTETANLVLTWTGQVSWDGVAVGANTLGLQLKQTGSQVSGQLSVYGPDGTGGPFAGTVSGNTLSFNFSVGNQGQGCGNAISGTATVETNTMTATFSGRRCGGQPVTNGRFTCMLPSPFRTSPFPVAGKWTANIPAVAALGGGVWTFDVSETPVDVYGSNVTGSVAVASSSLNLGSGAVTGAVTNTFPGPTTIARMTVTFAGACASNVLLNVGFPGGNPAFDGHQMTGGVSGTTCSGSIPQGLGLNLFRQ